LSQNSLARINKLDYYLPLFALSVTHFMLKLEIIVSEQKLLMFSGQQLIREYIVSTAKNGVGESYGSGKTPRGQHIIRAKIGANCPSGTVFVGRRPTGEIYQPQLKIDYPKRDWILTRILWLSGLEAGKNRLGQVDTMRRYIYIHGTPDDVIMGQPGSKGCVRMRNEQIIELFDLVPVQTLVVIK
jgi:L,D-transpeptidase YbiS